MSSNNWQGRKVLSPDFPTSSFETGALRSCLKNSTHAQAVGFQGTSQSTAPSTRAPSATIKRRVTFRRNVRMLNEHLEETEELMRTSTPFQPSSWRQFPRRSPTAQMQMIARSKNQGHHEEDDDEAPRPQMDSSLPPPLPLHLLLRPGEIKSSSQWGPLRRLLYPHAIDYVSLTGLAAIERLLCLKRILQVILQVKVNWDGTSSEYDLDLTWLQETFPLSSTGVKEDSWTCREMNINTTRRVSSSIISTGQEGRSLDLMRSQYAFLTFHHWMEHPNRERIFKIQKCHKVRSRVGICFSPYTLCTPLESTFLFYF